MADTPLAGQIALIIGGAGGLGSSISRSYARAGAGVIVGYRSRAEAAQALVATLEGDGHEAVQVEAESGESLKDLARHIAKTQGRLDVLINCAGYTRFVDHGDLDELDDETIDRIFRVNWRCSFAAVRAMRRLLDADDGGLVINISSIAGRTDNGSNLAYCAAKAAVDSMTRSLARALAPRIRVNSVSPGLIQTDFILQFDETWRNEQIAKTPIGRLATPEEVGDTCLAVATLMKAATGAIIPVDGGRPLT